MDGGLQNAPEDMARLIQTMDTGIGGVAGDRTQRNGNWVRRVPSRIANAVRGRISEKSTREAGEQIS